MRIQNITYALCMAATANAVRLQSTTQLEAENFGDWLEEHFKIEIDPYGLAQVESTTQLEAGNFGDWLREHFHRIEIGPYGLAQVNPELENNDLTQLAQLGSAA